MATVIFFTHGNVTRFFGKFVCLEPRIGFAVLRNFIQDKRENQFLKSDSISVSVGDRIRFRFCESFLSALSYSVVFISSF